MSNYSPDFRPDFSRYPFVYICAYFSLGILCAEKLSEYSDFYFLILSNILIASVILFSFENAQVIAKQLFLLAVFGLLGHFAHGEQHRNTGWSDWRFHRGKTEFQMNVVEVQAGKPWTKGIGNIQWKRGDDVFSTPIRSASLCKSRNYSN
jgi:hypothetical protein